MLRIFCKITGDDYEMLKSDTPESRKKVSALATIVFVPVIIWFVIGYMFAQRSLNLTTHQALLTATMMALLIFLLERTIIMANGGITIALFRFTLGLVIALLGSVLIDEIIFHDDIEKQLAESGKARVAADWNPEIERVKADVKTKELAWTAALKEANDEADGTGGSGRRGVDGISRQKLAVADKLESDYNQSKNELLKTQIMAQQKIDNSNTEAGLLTRINALFILIKTDGIMMAVYVLFTLFLFSMEFLVVLMKMFWKKTNYEMKLELIETIGKRRMEQMMQNPDEYHLSRGLLKPVGAFN
jgi:hypothetical protein